MSINASCNDKKQPAELERQADLSMNCYLTKSNASYS